MKNYRIAVIKGDGIGTEVINEGIKVLKAIEKLDSNIQFTFTDFDWGCDYYLEHQEMMPENGIELLSDFDAIYLGAVGSPTVKDHISLWGLLLNIRKSFDQYVNIRPIKLLKGIESPIANKTSKDIDMIFIRENTEGEYSNSGSWLYPDSEQEVVIQNNIFSRKGCERVMRYAFELAKEKNMTLTSISKGNALRYSMVFWDKIFEEISLEYPSVKTQTFLVDATCVHMVLHPEKFQVVVASNLFGDVLTDLGAVICGGLGFAAGANLNPERKFPSMFEPVHGSAIDIANKNIANPIAAIWSASQMLDYLGQEDWGKKVLAAIETVTESQKYKTSDIRGTTSTSELGDAIVKQLMKLQE